MRAYLLALSLLAVVAVSLSTALDPWFQNWQGGQARSESIIEVALGDSRRLFANHFFLKADAYFHNGYYATIYDDKGGQDKAHMAEGHQDGEEEEDFLGKPKDWIDGFSRHFFPSRHTHLGDSGCGHSCCQRAKEDKGHDDDCEHKGHDAEHDHHEESEGGSEGLERELLPWLRLSATLDPHRAETYVVAAYWLRSKLHKIDEAEQFLREGLQANPGNCEILLELGRIYFQDRKDPVRARGVLELALKKLNEREAGKPEPDTFLRAQILNNLAWLEREQRDIPRALDYYSQLLEISPNKQNIQLWIDYLKTNGPPIAAPGFLR